MDDIERTEIESLCMECGENGITQLLPCTIPHFKQVIITSFACSKCGNVNNEVISARAIGDYGMSWTLNVTNKTDLSRQIVRSEYASVHIPELELEVPALSLSKNSTRISSAAELLTTIEGLLGHFIDDLSMNQEERRNSSDSQAAEAIDKILYVLEKMKLAEKSFTLILDDPAGNSYIEFLSPSEALDNMSFSLGSSEVLDPSLFLKRYARTAKQNRMLGFATEYPNDDDDVKSVDDADTFAKPVDRKEKAETPVDDIEDGVDSVYEFVGTCPACLSTCPTRMHPIDIPYFKEVIIMATTCSSCNFKSSEIKSGGAISPIGRRIIFQLQTPEDLSRDILKSESCSVIIPDIDLELTPGTLGGKFTTIEGLLLQIKEEMQERIPFALGDSANPSQMNRLKSLIEALDGILDGSYLVDREAVTIIIDDQLANSYLQSFYAPDPDPQISIEDYHRTSEQDEHLGLTYLHTE